MAYESTPIHSPPEADPGEQETDPGFGDPVTFARNVLGVECWSKIEEIMRAIERGERKVLVRSCNGAGKTTAIAALCLWKLAQFPESIVLTTASSWTQVRRTLWGEIRKQARRSKLFEKGTITDTGIRVSDKHYALGISPSIPENAQGFHAPNMLIAIDEATGVDREIFDALSGNATSEDTQMIMICNPINIHSYPFEAEESGKWHLITISALEHPNVIEGREIIKGAVTREWIEDRLRAWSHEVTPDAPRSIYIPWLDAWFKKTPIVASRILGEWADNETEGFITIDLIKRSAERELPPVADGIKAIGIDIAKSDEGDGTVFAFFEGGVQLPFLEFAHSNTMDIANKAAELYEQGWHSITVDDSGLGGGVADRMRELGIPNNAVSFSEQARGFLKHRKNLANARAEMYFVLEEDIREGHVKLLDDKLFHAELTAARLATSENSTAYRMEDKRRIRKRLGHSPDKADATALARYGLRIEAYNMRKLFYA